VVINAVSHFMNFLFFLFSKNFEHKLKKIIYEIEKIRNMTSMIFTITMTLYFSKIIPDSKKDLVSVSVTVCNSMLIQD